MIIVLIVFSFVQDEVVKVSPHARAIRDVEDEELRSFFYGMSPLQVNFILFWVSSFHLIAYPVSALIK